MKQNTEEKKEDNKISHKLDVLEFFEQMRVTAPTSNHIFINAIYLLILPIYIYY